MTLGALGYVGYGLFGTRRRLQTSPEVEELEREQKEEPKS